MKASDRIFKLLELCEQIEPDKPMKTYWEMAADAAATRPATLKRWQAKGLPGSKKGREKASGALKMARKRLLKLQVHVAKEERDKRLTEENGFTYGRSLPLVRHGKSIKIVQDGPVVGLEGIFAATGVKCPLAQDVLYLYKDELGQLKQALDQASAEAELYLDQRESPEQTGS